MNRTTIAIVAVLGLLTTGIVFHNVNTDCVEIYVDYGPLNNGTKTTECVPAESSVLALDLLKNAGYSIEGTEEYGDATICRVNNFPDATQDPCFLMPLEGAYWAILVKKHQVVPMPIGTAGAWGWSQTGANEIYLNPGDSLGLVFADEGEVVFP